MESCDPSSLTCSPVTSTTHIQPSIRQRAHFEIPPTERPQMLAERSVRVRFAVHIGARSLLRRASGTYPVLIRGRMLRWVRGLAREIA
ncbi:hypothetical protein WN55_06591 [Dufourea novaeangliae]|uniref:Uncharacterized protein n=1 Tax=Dufourea novaeangliae TaxID=178035 RepID=A0A154PQZ2_DUFNO|nr:hypothetical protein WN55_06591 [Dufourea novaeangliae]